MYVSGMAEFSSFFPPNGELMTFTRASVHGSPLQPHTESSKRRQRERRRMAKMEIAHDFPVRDNR